MTSKVKEPSQAADRTDQVLGKSGSGPRDGNRTQHNAPPTHQDLVDESGKCLGTIPDGNVSEFGSLAPTVYLRRDLLNPDVQRGPASSDPDDVH